MMSFHKFSLWVIHQIDKNEETFLLERSRETSSVSCLVRWEEASHAKAHGGLGILDLRQ